MPVAEERGGGSPDRRHTPVPGDDRQVEREAAVRASFADAVEEAQVLGEAAERDVLAVVGRRRRIALALRQRLHGAAERRPCLVERDGVALVDELEGGGEPGQATSDDRDLHGRSTPRSDDAELRQRRELRRRAEHVEPVLLDPVQRLRVEIRERRDARRAAPVEPRQQRPPLGQVRPRPLRLVRHQCAPLRGAPPCSDVRFGHAELGQLVLRQVDTAERPVLGNVADDVDELKCDAERLGALPLGSAVHRDARDADGPGDAPAVAAEILERRVPRLLGVLDAAVDEVVERLARDRIPAARVGERDEHRTRVRAVLQPTRSSSSRCRFAPFSRPGSSAMSSTPRAKE